MNANVLLSVRDLHKSFGNSKVLEGIHFELKVGEIHALCGCNGAGKSTFLNIIMGFEKPDQGTIIVKGRHIRINSAKEAIDAGIAIVQQELSLIPDLSVAENIFLGQEPKKSMGFVDFKTMNQQATKLLEYLEFDVPVHVPLRTLSVAEQHLVEIAKALSHANADIIFMDEPTSALGENDTHKLFKSIKALAEKGKGIVYVSHRLSEIFEIADSYTVFRDGSYILSGDLAEIDRDKLIKTMIGSDIESEFIKENIATKEVMLDAQSLQTEYISDASFKVYKGEILGFYGLVGSGRTELLNALFGIDNMRSGDLYIKNKRLNKGLKKHTVQNAINNGIAYVTESRKDTGLVLTSSVGENISISSLKKDSNWGFINKLKEKSHIQKMVKLFKIKVTSAEQLAIHLSGGNQQKLILARWALMNCDLLLLDEPTRGIDIGAKKEIYKYVSDMASQGKSIIFVSSELPEIINMSDRILVFKKGKIIAEVDRVDATQQYLLHLSS